MSKLAKKPLIIPDGIEVAIEENAVSVRGGGKTITVPRLAFIDVQLSGRTLTLTTQEAERQARANWGTMAALLKNALRGIQEGFSKILEIEGIGYRAVLEGKTLVFSVGFTHPVRFTPPDGITITIEKNQLSVRGIDRALVGETAARIRNIKPPEPYKGKGIHYRGEVIRRKEGKKVAGAGAAKAA